MNSPSNQRHQRLRRYAAATLLGLLAACGSGDDTTPLAEAQTTNEAPAETAQSLLSKGSPSTNGDLRIVQTKDPAMRDYLNGLEHLRRGEYAEATRAFSNSLAVNPDDANMVLARGVSQLLGGQYDSAKSDILRLGRHHRHAQVWNYAHSAMTGKMSGLPAVPDYMIADREQNSCVGRNVVYVPGAVIQGDDTFTTDYASFVLYRLASAYREQRCTGNVDARTLAPLALRAARWFAHMNMGRPELLGYQVEKAAALLAAGDLDGALTYANFAQVSAPKNGYVQHLIARVHLEAGQTIEARRKYTRALALGSNLAESYLGRAVAAAGIGDNGRAQRDLRVAQSINDDAADDWEDRIDDAAVDAAEENRDQLLRELQVASRRAADDSVLDQLARRVHAYAEPRRIRYDEVYQDRVYQLLNEANREDSADAWHALARYIGQEAELRGESVEKGRPFVPYRHQSTRNDEMRVAMTLTDRALKLDGEHVGALMMRAELLAYFGKPTEAEQTAERALAIDPDDPQAATLFAMFRGQRAANLQSQAVALRQDTCTSSTREERRSDGIWEVTTRTCVPPSPGELARANALEAEANRLRAQSRAVLKRAIDMTRGTYEGYLLQAEAYLWSRDWANAVRALRKAVELDPEDLRAHESLIVMLPRVGEREAAAEHRIIVNKNLQTTAAPLLNLIWDQIAAGQFDTAGRLLQRAWSLDPQDARIPTYVGLTYELAGRPREAEAAYRLALALERARLAIDGGDAMPRHMSAYALSVQVARRLAAILNAGNRADQATATLSEVLAIADRVQPGWQSHEMYEGRLPGAEGTVDNGANAVGDAYVALGHIYRRLGQTDAAKQSYQRAIDLGPDPNIPRIGTAHGDTNFSGYAREAAGEGLLALAELFAEEGNVERANEVISLIGYMNISRDSQQRAAQLTEAISRTVDRNPTNQPRMSEQDYRYWAESLKGRALPAFHGTWQITPEEDWRYVRPAGQVRFEANGRYTIATSSGVTDQGIWGSQGGVGWGGSVQLSLISDQRTGNTWYVDAPQSGEYFVTRQDAAKFKLRKLQ